jgi:hypothetical protein
MTQLDLTHVSPSSFALHMKCPRQWQDKYMFGNRGPTTGAMFLGTAVHLGEQRLLSGEPLGDYWNDAKAKEDGPIVWGKDNELTLRSMSYKMIQNYYDQVGKYLQVEATELEFLHQVPGVGPPFKGFIDLVTHQILIDYKSTGYFNPKQVRANEEWKLAQRIYQLVVPKPSEIHVITRKGEIVVPTQTTFKALHFGLFDREQTHRILRDEWARILWHLEEYGERPWPGKGLHEYADKYCQLPNCCSVG